MDDYDRFCEEANERYRNQSLSDSIGDMVNRHMGGSYACDSCHKTFMGSVGWSGKCPFCGSWNTHSIG